MQMGKDPVSGLELPMKFIDEKQSLKKSLDDWVDKTVREHQHLDYNYFLTLHAKFDPDGITFTIDAPKITNKLPPFISNSFVYWVCNRRGMWELLWMVTRGRDKKLKVEFNKNGVAYLQAKGAMPKPT
jgi:hypothetical protein